MAFTQHIFSFPSVLSNIFHISPPPRSCSYCSTTFLGLSPPMLGLNVTILNSFFNSLYWRRRFLSGIKKKREVSYRILFIFTIKGGFSPFFFPSRGLHLYVIYLPTNGEPFVLLAFSLVVCCSNCLKQTKPKQPTRYQS